MGFTTLDQVLWAAGFAGHVVLLLVLCLRSRWRHFPVFTGLIGYQALVTVVLFSIYRYGSSHAYFLAYWQLALGDYCFQIALIVEMARRVILSAGSPIPGARKGFLACTFVCVLLFATVSFAMSPLGVSGLDLWEMRATLFTSLLTCGLFVLMSMASNYFGLPWRSHVIALGQGLAAWSAMAVIGDVVHIATGWHREFAIFDQLRMYFYLGALVLWCVTFWAEEQKPAPLPENVQHSIESLHRQVQWDIKQSSQLALKQASLTKQGGVHKEPAI